MSLCRSYTDRHARRATAVAVFRRGFTKVTNRRLLKQRIEPGRNSVGLLLQLNKEETPVCGVPSVYAVQQRQAMDRSRCDLAPCHFARCATLTEMDGVAHKCLAWRMSVPRLRPNKFSAISAERQQTNSRRSVNKSACYVDLRTLAKGRLELLRSTATGIPFRYDWGGLFFDDR